MCIYIYIDVNFSLSLSLYVCIYIYDICSIKYVQPGGPVPGESPQTARLAGAYGHPGGATAKSPLLLLDDEKQNMGISLGKTGVELANIRIDPADFGT